MEQANQSAERDPRQVEQQKYDLVWVFAFLSLAHVAAFYAAIPMSERSRNALPVWIAYGGIGTITVWFAWTCRTVFERVMRVGIVFCLFYVSVTNVIPYYMHSQILANRASIQIE